MAARSFGNPSASVRGSHHNKSKKDTTNYFNPCTRRVPHLGELAVFGVFRV